jgi:hypothetical protein
MRECHLKKQLIRHENFNNVFPESTVFRQAWEKGEIDENILLKLLGENQLLESPEYYLQQMAHKKKRCKNSHHDLDRIMAKWLPPLWMKVWQNGKCQ